MEVLCADRQGHNVASRWNAEPSRDRVSAGRPVSGSTSVSRSAARMAPRETSGSGTALALPQATVARG